MEGRAESGRLGGIFLVVHSNEIEKYKMEMFYLFV